MRARTIYDLPVAAWALGADGRDAPERTLDDVATEAGADFPGWDAVDDEWAP